MILTSTLEPYEVERIVRVVSAQSYESNLGCGPYAGIFGLPREMKTMRDGRIRLAFCLRTHDCTKPGSRRTAMRGYRSIHASWQAHRDVMTAIFEADPKAHLKTAVATYDGRADFLDKFPETYYHQVGSQMFIGEMAV